MLSPFLSLANAPCCQSIGATSLVALLKRLCLICKALWHNSSLSSNICQNVSISLSLDKAASTKLIVTTP